MSSRETDAIIAYVKATVPDAVVTATVGKYVSPANPCSPHSPGSYHCKEGTDGAGLAVDFGGTPVQQIAAFNALKPVAGQLAELIHNPTGAVKNGMWVNPLQVYGATVWAAHLNHTHVAVNRGIFLPSPVPVSAPEVKVPPTYDPPLQIVDACDNPAGPGAYGLAPDGGVLALGGAPWRGVDHQPLGKDYWVGRHAAKIQVLGSGYRITATSGETYDYP